LMPPWSSSHKSSSTTRTPPFRAEIIEQLLLS
jgi:hypothetical protein